MNRGLSRLTIAIAVLLMGFGLAFHAPEQAQAVDNAAGQPQLFANYYSPTSAPAPTQLYVSPRPTPPVVGHTYVTYQALMPHEFLYPHSRVYWNYHPEADNWTRTSVVWRRTGLNLNGIFNARPTQPAPLNPLAPLLGTTRF